MPTSNIDHRASSPVRTRFAPSPTGFLHVGGVRTALFAWLVARQADGQFLLRIEDTDKTREVKGSEQHITDCLGWLELRWDEQPYRQSERLEIYREWVQKLIDAGKAYADPYTPQELDGLREKAKNQKKPFLFRDYRPENPPEWNGSQPLRFKSEPKAYEWQDAVMGKLSSGPEAVDDFIILKSDGFPTYNFAHIIDDHLMNISHVIRSQEFLPSVPKFLNLYEALGIERPILATLPYVLGPDGKKKLSKRDGAKDILDYKQEGYLPETMVSFLATLGWNDGTDQEIFSREELVEKFSLDRVQRGGARFDEKRLEWMNGYYIRKTSLDTLYELSKGFWPESAIESSNEYKKQVLALIQERIKHFAEITTLTRFFFEEPDPKAVKNIFADRRLNNRLTVDQIKQALNQAHDNLNASDFTISDLENRLRGAAKEIGFADRILFMVVRVALTGNEVSPGLFETLNVLGQEKSLARIKRASEVT